MASQGSAKGQRKPGQVSVGFEMVEKCFPQPCGVVTADGGEEGFGEGGEVAGAGDGEAGAGHEFGEHAPVGDDGGDAEGEGFDGDEAEAFGGVAGGEAEAVGVFEEAAFLVAADEAGVYHPVAGQVVALAKGGLQVVEALAVVFGGKFAGDAEDGAEGEAALAEFRGGEGGGFHGVEEALFVGAVAEEADAEGGFGGSGVEGAAEGGGALTAGFEEGG